MEEVLKNFDLVPRDLVMILVASALFLLFVRLMRVFVFDPYRALLEHREGASVGRIEEAANLERQAKKNLNLLEQNLAEARIGIMKEKAAALTQASHSAAAVVAEADAEAAKIKAAGRGAIREEVLKAEKSLESELGAMVERAADRATRGDTRRDSEGAAV